MHDENEEHGCEPDAERPGRALVRSHSAQTEAASSHA